TKYAAIGVEWGALWDQRRLRSGVPAVPSDQRCGLTDRSRGLDQRRRAFDGVVAFVRSPLTPALMRRVPRTTLLALRLLGVSLPLAAQGPMVSPVDSSTIAQTIRALPWREI